MPNRVPPYNRSLHEINEIDDAVYLFEYAEYLKKEIEEYKGKGNDILYTPLYLDFYYFLNRSDSTKTLTSRFSRFLESKIISDKYKKDFVVDIALEQPELIADFMCYDEDELKTTKEKDTALSAGKYLIKESNGEQPILIDYIKRSKDEHIQGAVHYFFLYSELLHYSYAKAIAETGNKKVEEEFAKVFEFENDPKNNFDKLYSSDIEQYRKKIREEKNSPQKSTKEELEAKIRFMNELKEKPDNAKYLASYLCNKEENDNQKSLLAEIAIFGIYNLESSDQDTLKKIFNEKYTIDEREQTLLDYYSQNSKDSGETRIETLFYLQEFQYVGRYYNYKPEDIKSKLTHKIWFMEDTMNKHSDQKRYLVPYLCDIGKNGGQKSLLAEIAIFGIYNLESSDQDTLKKIFNEKYTIDEREQTLLDYYSQNSKDSGETRIETLFYLQEFQYVGRYYNYKPEDIKSKLTHKIWFMEDTMNKHSDQKRYLVPYLCDIGKNGGQKSLLAEIAIFGIYNLESSDQDTLKKIFNEKYTIDEREQTLLDYYSQNSKDSGEIKRETLTYFWTKKDLEEKFLTLKEFTPNSLDAQKDLVPYLCDIEKNGGQKSLLAEIVDFGIDNLESSDQNTLKEILNTVRTENGQTLLDYYSQNSKDSEKTRIKTSFYLQDFQDFGPYLSSNCTERSKLARKIRFMNELRKKPDNAKYLAPCLCNKEENDNQKSLLDEIVDFEIDNLEYSEQKILIDILKTVRTKNGQTLLDSEGITAKTSFYLREFRDVTQCYDPEDPASKLLYTFRFIEKTMNDHSDQIGYLVPYLCDKKQNGGRKSLLDEIVDFGIYHLETSEQNTLKNILKTVRTEDGQTLLDSGRIQARTSFCLQEFQDVGQCYRPKDIQKKLVDKFKFMKKIMNKYPDQKDYLAPYLCFRGDNGGQKSLLAEIVGFRIYNLEASDQETLKKIFNEKYTIDEREQTLLDYYSQNSKDSGETRIETLFYLQEFQYVGRYYNYKPEDIKSKLTHKIWFMEDTMNKHSDQKRYLVPYLCDIGKNGGQKSLLAEIAIFGIYNLESSDQDTLKKIFNEKYTIDERERILLDYYSQNSKDSGEIKTETLFYLQEFQYVGRYYNYKPEDIKSKLTHKIWFMEDTMNKHSDQKRYLVPYLCDIGKNGGQKSLLAEIAIFGIYNLESSERYTLKKIFNEKYTIDEREQTLLDYYSQNSKDSGEIKTETLFYLQEFQYVGRYYNYKPEDIKSKLTHKIWFMEDTMNKHSDQKRYLVPYLCDIGKNGGQKSLLAEIATSGINNLEYSERYTLKKILNEKYTIDGYEWTLLDYYRENSTDSGAIKAETLKKLQNFLGVGPREQPLTRRVALPDLGLKMVFAVNNSDGTVKTPKDINKALRESDTQTINKGNSGRSFD